MLKGKKPFPLITTLALMTILLFIFEILFLHLLTNNSESSVLSSNRSQLQSNDQKVLTEAKSIVSKIKFDPPKKQFKEEKKVDKKENKKDENKEKKDITGKSISEINSSSNQLNISSNITQISEPKLSSLLANLTDEELSNCFLFDRDLDGDIDSTDLSAVQACKNGNAPFPCARYDINLDSVITDYEITISQECSLGSSKYQGFDDELHQSLIMIKQLEEGILDKSVDDILDLNTQEKLELTNFISDYKSLSKKQLALVNGKVYFSSSSTRDSKIPSSGELFTFDPSTDIQRIGINDEYKLMTSDGESQAVIINRSTVPDNCVITQNNDPVSIIDNLNCMHKKSIYQGNSLKINDNPSLRQEVETYLNYLSSHGLIYWYELGWNIDPISSRIRITTPDPNLPEITTDLHLAVSDYLGPEPDLESYAAFLNDNLKEDNFVSISSINDPYISDPLVPLQVLQSISEVNSFNERKNTAFDYLRLRYYDNTPVSQCGNSICDTNENPDTCPLDCNLNRVFVTSNTYNGNLGGLTGADSKCQQAADNVNLGGEWFAFIGNSSIVAPTRMESQSIPYNLLNGTVVWPNGSINRNEYNLPVLPSNVWTGVPFRGINSLSPKEQTCKDWTYSGDDVTIENNKATILLSSSDWEYYYTQNNIVEIDPVESFSYVDCPGPICKLSLECDSYIDDGSVIGSDSMGNAQKLVDFCRVVGNSGNTDKINNEAYFKQVSSCSLEQRLYCFERLTSTPLQSKNPSSVSTRTMKLASLPSNLNPKTYYDDMGASVPYGKRIFFYIAPEIEISPEDVKSEKAAIDGFMKLNKFGYQVSQYHSSQKGNRKSFDPLGQLLKNQDMQILIVESHGSRTTRIAVECWDTQAKADKRVKELAAKYPQWQFTVEYSCNYIDENGKKQDHGFNVNVVGTSLYKMDDQQKNRKALVFQGSCFSDFCMAPNNQLANTYISVGKNALSNSIATSKDYVLFSDLFSTISVMKRYRALYTNTGLIRGARAIFNSVGYKYSTSSDFYNNNIPPKDNFSPSSPCLTNTKDPLGNDIVDSIFCQMQYTNGNGPEVEVAPRVNSLIFGKDSGRFSGSGNIQFNTPINGVQGQEAKEITIDLTQCFGDVEFDRAQLDKYSNYIKFVKPSSSGIPPMKVKQTFHPVWETKTDWPTTQASNSVSWTVDTLNPYPPGGVYTVDWDRYYSVYWDKASCPSGDKPTTDHLSFQVGGIDGMPASLSNGISTPYPGAWGAESYASKGAFNRFLTQDEWWDQLTYDQRKNWKWYGSITIDGSLKSYPAQIYFNGQGHLSDYSTTEPKALFNINGMNSGNDPFVNPTNPSDLVKPYEFNNAYNAPQGSYKVLIPCLPARIGIDGQDAIEGEYYGCSGTSDYRDTCPPVKRCNE